MKDNLDHAMMSGFLDSLDYEAENMVRTARTLDHKEAVRAFVEKQGGLRGPLMAVPVHTYR